jgi:hypothetical protein
VKENGSTNKLPTVDNCAVFQISSHKLGRVAFLVLYGLARAAFPQQTVAQAPVYEITPVESSIKFDVESSVPI